MGMSLKDNGLPLEWCNGPGCMMIWKPTLWTLPLIYASQPNYDQQVRLIEQFHDGGLNPQEMMYQPGVTTNGEMTGISMNILRDVIMGSMLILIKDIDSIRMDERCSWVTAYII